MQELRHLWRCRIALQRIYCASVTVAAARQTPYGVTFIALLYRATDVVVRSAPVAVQFLIHSVLNQ
jgi:hypothetical protein